MGSIGESIPLSRTLNRGNISWTIFVYLFRETMFAFLVSFLFFFFIFFVNQLLLMAQEILTKKVPLPQVTLLVLYSLPQIIAMSTPFAALLGTLMTVGRLSSDNEILVMLSSGLSYINIFAPVVAVGITVSLVAFMANDVLLPAGTIQFNRLYRRILVSTPALELESNSIKRFKETVIVTGNVSGNSIEDMLILDRTGEGERRLIMAKNALFFDAGADGLALDLRNAFIQTSKEIERRDYDYAASDSLRYRIPQEDLIQAASTIGPREMSSRDVHSEIKIKEVARAENLLERTAKSLEAAMNYEAALRAGPNSGLWNQKTSLGTTFMRELQLVTAAKVDRNLSIYRIEFYKKFSMPLGALSLIILAIPLGLMAKKSGQTVGFILGLVLSVFYWALIIGGQNMGIRLGYSPFWTMWLPNILSVSIGSVLLVLRVRK
jgi:lipopolysaccharide export system permease protein